MRSAIRPVLIPCLCACLFAGLLAGFAAAQERPESPEQIASRSDYIVGVEDVLYVSVYEEPSIQLEVKVRPDGKISLPMIHDVKAEGLTPDQLRLQIAEKLKRYITNPNVAVIVNEINSFKVYVLGEVQSQGTLSFYKPTTLLQAMAAAGGLSEFSKKELTLIRNTGENEEWRRIDCRELLAGKPTAKNIFLRPGDVLLFH